MLSAVCIALFLAIRPTTDVGRKFWVFGSAVLKPGKHLDTRLPVKDMCAESSDTYCWDVEQAATIVRVTECDVRYNTVRGPAIWVSDDDYWREMTVTSQRSTRIVWLRLRDILTWAHPVGIDSYTGPTVLAPYGTGNHGRYMRAPGEGCLYLPSYTALWRFGSFDDPAPLLRGESNHVRRAFHERKVVPGMTRSLVIRLLGFPDYWSYEKLMAQRDWEYSGPAPFDYAVHFDQSGRVRKAGMEGMLP